jgi:hypothetical protein
MPVGQWLAASAAVSPQAGRGRSTHLRWQTESAASQTPNAVALGSAIWLGFGLRDGRLRRRGVEDSRSRDLRCNQERRDNGWQAYQSQNLIHRKHRISPPANPRNQRPAQLNPCAIPNSFPIVAKNVRAWRILRTNEGNIMATVALVRRCGVLGRNSKGKDREQSAQAVLPASMVMTDPVILRPPSPNRYSTMRATSSVSGNRRKALRLAIRLR